MWLLDWLIGHCATRQLQPVGWLLQSACNLHVAPPRTQACSWDRCCPCLLCQAAACCGLPLAYPLLRVLLAPLSLPLLPPPALRACLVCPLQKALVHQWVSADPNMKKQVKASLLATLGTQVCAAPGGRLQIPAAHHAQSEQGACRAGAGQQAALCSKWRSAQHPLKAHPSGRLAPPSTITAAPCPAPCCAGRRRPHCGAGDCQGGSGRGASQRVARADWRAAGQHGRQPLHQGAAPVHAGGAGLHLRGGCCAPPGGCCAHRAQRSMRSGWRAAHAAMWATREILSSSTA